MWHTFQKNILPHWRAKAEKQFHKDHGLDPETCIMPEVTTEEGKLSE